MSDVKNTNARIVPIWQMWGGVEGEYSQKEGKKGLGPQIGAEGGIGTMGSQHGRVVSVSGYWGLSLPLLDRSYADFGWRLCPWYDGRNRFCLGVGEQLDVYRPIVLRYYYTELLYARVPNIVLGGSTPDGPIGGFFMSVKLGSPSWDFLGPKSYSARFLVGITG